MSRRSALFCILMYALPARAAEFEAVPRYQKLLTINPGCRLYMHTPAYLGYGGAGANVSYNRVYMGTGSSGTVFHADIFMELINRESTPLELYAGDFLYFTSIHRTLPKQSHNSGDSQNIPNEVWECDGKCDVYEATLATEYGDELTLQAFASIDTNVFTIPYTFVTVQNYAIERFGYDLPFTFECPTAPF